MDFFPFKNKKNICAPQHKLMPANDDDDDDFSWGFILYIIASTPRRHPLPPPSSTPLPARVLSCRQRKREKEYSFVEFSSFLECKRASFFEKEIFHKVQRRRWNFSSSTAAAATRYEAWASPCYFTSIFVSSWSKLLSMGEHLFVNTIAIACFPLSS